MREKIIKALKWDFLGTFIEHFATLITSLILARILTPEEFGIVAMALVFIAVFSSFSDFGLNQGLIQTGEKDNITYSSIFFINIFLGGFLSLFTFLLAANIAHYFGEPKLENIIKVLSIIFIIESFGIIQKTILIIELNFKILTYLSLFAKILGAGVGIILALLNYNVYALVWQIIVTSIISVLSLWYFNHWRPVLGFNFFRVKEILKFSLYIFLDNSLFVIIKRIDDLVIAKLFSASTLGYFGRANSLFNTIRVLLSRSINQVMFPVLSSLKGEEHKAKFDAIYYSTYEIICALSFLLSGIFIVSGEEIIIGLFGRQWEESVFIFQVIMLRIFLPPTNAFLFCALLAKGKSKENFYHGLVRKAIKLFAIVIAYNYGFIAFLYYLVGTGYIRTIYNNLINSYYLDVSFFKQVYALFSYLFLFLLAVFFVTVLIEDNGFSVIEGMSKIVLYSFSYIILVFLIKKETFLLIHKELLNVLTKKEEGKPNY